MERGAGAGPVVQQLLQHGGHRPALRCDNRGRLRWPSPVPTLCAELRQRQRQQLRLQRGRLSGEVQGHELCGWAEGIQQSDAQTDVQTGTGPGHRPANCPGHTPANVPTACLLATTCRPLPPCPPPPAAHWHTPAAQRGSRGPSMPPPAPRCPPRCRPRRRPSSGTTRSDRGGGGRQAGRRAGEASTESSRQAGRCAAHCVARAPQAPASPKRGSLRPGVPTAGRRHRETNAAATQALGWPAHGRGGREGDGGQSR